ncbi:MAG: hypothetical protein FWE59_03395 [Oscillospiraceae bacterium]|nr:hypothetical protein [Oscillospiraceae bacterium]
MKSKTWLIMFPATIAMVLCAVAALNILVDPFGIFGDPVYDWYDFNYTNNQRLAKIAYLDRHAQAYDSYLVGSSVAGSIPVEALGRYMDGKFFNLCGNGGDMRRSRLLIEYLIGHYPVKNIVLAVSFADGATHNTAATRLTHMMPAWVATGDSPAAQSVSYMLADMRYAMNKVASRPQAAYLPQSFDAYVAETGGFDMKKLDNEPIGDLAAYLIKHPRFAKTDPEQKTLWRIEECVADVAAISSLCRERGVNLVVVFPPVCHAHLQETPAGQRDAFFRALAGAVDFWDFSYTSVSEDPRYFYDIRHFRTSLATMMLARMFGDGSVYLPPDFGAYVTAGNVGDHVARLADPPQAYRHETDLPVLVWPPEGGGGIAGVDGIGGIDGVADIADFEAQISALQADGYQSVSFAQIVDYVEKGAPLPGRPVVIALDGGRPLDIAPALRVLRLYGMEATYFATGPLGQHPDGAGEAAYIEAFRSDFAALRGSWAPAEGATPGGTPGETANPLLAYAYPPGEGGDVLTDALLRELGVKVTLTLTLSAARDPETNTLVQGLPESLLQLAIHATRPA